MKAPQRIFAGIVFLLFAQLPANPQKLPEASPPAARSYWQRHLHWLDAYLATRYIYVDNRTGRVQMNDLQYKFQAKGQWRFDEKGSTYLQFRAETGDSLQPGWNFSGWGQNDHNLSLSLKDLFVGQKVGSQVEFQVGGIEFDRGVGTEATFADEDGFQVGYRVQVTPPRGWWPERMQVTVARIDEFHHPSVFARLPGLGEPNAVQVLAQKSLGDNLQVSGEFDRIAGVNFLRGVMQWSPPAMLNRLVLETIVRTSDDPSVGYSLQLNRTLKRAGPWNFRLTYSHIEWGVFARGRARLLLNGDQPNLGQRVALQLSRSLGHGLTLTSYVSRQLDHTVSIPRHDRWRAQLVLNYRFTRWLNPRPGKLTPVRN